MKFKLFIFFLTYSIFSNSQCFDCGHSIGGHVEDYVVDIDKASDGIVLTINPNQGWGRSIYKYDFNCNLKWSNDFQPDSGFTDSMIFSDTAVDDNNNIYSTIRNYRGGIVVEGFNIERGNSLIKLNSNGNIQWVRKISDESHLTRKVHVWMDNIFVIGLLDEGVDTNIGLSVPDGYRNQYFVAKFDTSGNLIKSKQYGEEKNETFYDSQIDEDGNLYFIGTVPNSSVSYPYLTKIDSDLNLIWTQKLSNYINWSFIPWTLYYNSTNENLYIWVKYYNINGTSTGCNVGSAIMEVSKITGGLENSIVIDNCGFDSPVSNGTGDVVQRSFMAHEGGNLYILSSFRGEITVGGTTIVSSQDIHGVYNSDLFLHKINLMDFSSDFILRSTSGNYYESAPYRDLAGPILALDDNSIYITSSFTGNPITINGNVIDNNSGNNNRDILYYKYLLDQEDLSGIIEFQNTCFSETTDFTINGNFDSVLWDFDDPASGIENASNLINPSHIFTNSGVYDISATVVCGSDTEIINIEVFINEKPIVGQVENVYGCEDTFGSQISSSFDTSRIETDLVGDRTDLFIEYYDQNGNKLPSPLPNPISNSIPGIETITSRVAYINNPNCFTETSFDLIVKPIPEVQLVNDLYECDDDRDGKTMFDLSDIETTLLNGRTGLSIRFFRENGEQLPSPLPNKITNMISNRETITVKITDPNTDCFNETTFDLIVSPLPVANSLNPLIGCDDDNDGISEYFDTSAIAAQVANDQIDILVSYYDTNGNPLPSPLPNPYTNTVANEETIMVRVTNLQTYCYEETPLVLRTSAKPLLNTPFPVYSCNNGNGFANFDLSNIESDIIGDQVGLYLSYFDENGSKLPIPLPSTYENTVAWKETITVRVENSLNAMCYTETNFDLIVNERPTPILEPIYFLCHLEPSLPIQVENDFDYYSWSYEDSSIISETHEALLINAGSYVLTLGKTTNGIYCENSFNFELIRSSPPIIKEVRYRGLSDNNFIEIITTGDGDFEYSLDGINFKESNYFSDIIGGIYKVMVRDKNGCGNDSEEVVIVDYPNFFTPNNDGQNDYWHIYGIAQFPDSRIFVYDRYGKLLEQLSPNNLGWDGYFNGKKMISNDYWFKADLGEGTVFSGHFTLKR